MSINLLFLLASYSLTKYTDVISQYIKIISGHILCERLSLLDTCPLKDNVFVVKINHDHLNTLLTYVSSLVGFT